MKQPNEKTATNMVCVCCPIGCSLTIDRSDHEYIVTGNKCQRGKKYAVEELTAPKRVITSTVKISGGEHCVIPVKTDAPAPKEKIFTIMDILASVSVQAPVRTGDIILENVADTGVNIIATKTDLGKTSIKLGRI